MNTSTNPYARKTRLTFRILAGVLAVLFLLVSLPIAILEAVAGSWMAWFLALCSLLAGIGMAGAARTGEWMFTFPTGTSPTGFANHATNQPVHRPADRPH